MFIGIKIFHISEMHIPLTEEEEDMSKLQGRKGLYADLSLFVVGIIWGSGFVATKHALEYVEPMYMMTFRFVIAFILMSIVFHKKMRSISKKDIAAGVIIGFFMCGGFAAQTIGLKYTTASKNAFLTGASVVIVPFLYWVIINKKPDIYNVAAAILCLIGIGTLTLDGGFSINFGDALTLICAVLFAAQIVAIGYFAKKHDPIVLTVLQFGAAAVFSLITAVVFEPFPTEFAVEGVGAVLYLSLFNTLIAFLIQNVAQKYTTATHAAILLSLESVFGTIFSVMFLGERFTTKLIIGCTIIFIAIITAETKWNFLKKKKKDEYIPEAISE